MKFSLKKKVTEEDRLEVKKDSKNKVVLVWGSLNSGKSIISTFIAKELARKCKDKNVILLYTDEHLPIIPCFFPDKRLENIESLGNFYTPIKITKNYLIENIVTLKDINNLALLGFLKGEHFAMYPNITNSLINQLFRKLKEEFDYIIIDGTTFFQGNQITFQCFEFADIYLKIKENNIKSLSYFCSAENFLNSVGIKMKDTKIILNKVNNEIDNRVDFIINNSEKVEEVCKMGDISKLDDRKFLKSIKDIVEEVF